jgi:hypothetical protein
LPDADAAAADALAPTVVGRRAIRLDIRAIQPRIPAAMSRFDGRKIIEPEKFHRSAPLSGTLFVPAISAFVPPSGEFFTKRS